MDLAYAIWIINPAAQYILSPDGQSIAVWIGPGTQPTQTQLNAAWVTAQAQIAAQQAKAALVAQHKASLAAQYTAGIGTPAQIAADLTALATIATALESGVQPTPAQQLIIDRVLVRLMIVLNS